MEVIFVHRSMSKLCNTWKWEHWWTWARLSGNQGQYPEGKVDACSKPSSLGRPSCGSVCHHGKLSGPRHPAGKPLSVHSWTKKAVPPRLACSPAVALAGMPTGKGLSAAQTRAVLSCDDIMRPEGMAERIGYSCPLCIVFVFESTMLSSCCSLALSGLLGSWITPTMCFREWSTALY